VHKRGVSTPRTPADAARPNLLVSLSLCPGNGRWYGKEPGDRQRGAEGKRAGQGVDSPGAGGRGTVARLLDLEVRPK
jgi:hypothetical protein